jgi:hypothetical protein
MAVLSAPRGSLVLTASSGKRLLPRDAHDSVGVGLARPAHRPEAVDQVGGEPDQTLAVHAGTVLIADAAERERGSDGVEGGTVLASRQ